MIWLRSWVRDGESGACLPNGTRLAECPDPVHAEDGNTMKLRATYPGPEAQRFALEPLPYGADWPGVADIAETTFVYVSERRIQGVAFYAVFNGVFAANRVW
jgi:hypothetical protein